MAFIEAQRSSKWQPGRFLYSSNLSKRREQSDQLVRIGMQAGVEIPEQGRLGVAIGVACHQVSLHHIHTKVLCSYVYVPR
jgi:hypothetical protein